MTAPRLLDTAVHFRFTPDDESVTAVSLSADPVLPGSRSFRADDQGWLLTIPRPALQRFEYRFDVTAAGGTQTILDPDNPVAVPTAFGDRSVFEQPGYAAPSWLDGTAPEGSFEDFALSGETVEDIPVTMWSPEGAAPSDPLPLLLVHDGPEYDRLASISRYSAVLIAAGKLPRHRLALVHPVLRDAWYSGSPRYLRSIVAAGLSELANAYALTAPVVVMGASLGGLTSLLVGLLGAPRVGGVFAQSGSFFHPRTDAQESTFPWFHRICEQVRHVLDAEAAAHPLRVGMTCGALEENVANNRRVARALTRAGHDVNFTVVPDLHNYTAWRDALDPHLTQVLRGVWGEGQG